jgi:hypothetical protein
MASSMWQALPAPRTRRRRRPLGPATPTWLPLNFDACSFSLEVFLLRALMARAGPPPRGQQRPEHECDVRTDGVRSVYKAVCTAVHDECRAVPAGTPGPFLRSRLMAGRSFRRPRPPLFRASEHTKLTSPAARHDTPRSRWGAARASRWTTRGARAWRPSGPRSSTLSSTRCTPKAKRCTPHLTTLTWWGGGAG